MSGDRFETNGIAPWRLRDVLPIIPHESLDGYVARVAAAEFLPRSLDITALAGAIYGHRPQLSRCDLEGLLVAADCLRVPPDDLIKRGYIDAGDPRRISFFDTTIDRRLASVRTRAFAPGALAESPYHRALWMLRPFPFSDETWEVLIDTCPNDFCGVTQRWHHTNGIDLCDCCAEPLIRAKAPLVPLDLRPHLRAAVGIIHPDADRRIESQKELPAPLRDMGGGDLLDLLCAVAGVVDPSIRYSRARHLISRRAKPEDVISAVASSWSILAAWPHGFEKLAVSRLAMRAGRFGDGNSGATTDFLLSPERAQLTPSVARVVEVLTARLRNNAEAGYRIVKAASVTGTPVPKLVESRRRGEIPTVFHLIGDQPIPLLDRAFIDGLSGGIRIAGSWAATRLGVNARAIEELANVGVLARAVTPPGRDAQGYVTRASLHALAERLQSLGHHAIPDGLRLRKAMAAVGERPKPWAAVIEAMLGGQLRFQIAEGPTSLVDRVTVSHETMSLLRTLALQAPNNGRGDMLSRLEATEMLNIHPKGARHLFEDCPTSYGPTPTIPLTVVLKLAEAYIAPAEIGARLNVKPHDVGHLMRAKGLQKLSVAGYDRQAVAAKFPELASI